MGNIYNSFEKEKRIITSMDTAATIDIKIYMEDRLGKSSTNIEDTYLSHNLNQLLIYRTTFRTRDFNARF